MTLVIISLQVINFGNYSIIIKIISYMYYFLKKYLLFEVNLGLINNFVRLVTLIWKFRHTCNNLAEKKKLENQNVDKVGRRIHTCFFFFMILLIFLNCLIVGPIVMFFVNKQLGYTDSVT